MAVETLRTWSPFTKHVQNDIPDSGKFVDAKTILLAAGPPKLSDMGSGINVDLAYPIGVMENFAVMQTRTIQRIFEIGSSKSYFVPGRNIGQATFGRTLYNGRSLLRVLHENTKTRNGADAPDFDAFRLKPGEGLFFINLASDFFHRPFGLLMVIVDNNLSPYGAAYLEECHTQGHQLSVNSQSTVIVEGASAQFDQIIPVSIPASLLFSGQQPLS